MPNTVTLITPDILSSQHGEAMADVKTTASATIIDNISSVYGPSVSR